MNKIAKTTIVLMIVTIISKFLGFGRELVLGVTYGTTLYSDIFITSMNIPNILFASIGNAIATTFIPLYFENENTVGEKKSLKFTNNILNIILLLALILSIIAFIFAEPLVKIFAMGFKGEELYYTVKFTKIMIFGGVAVILSNIMTSFLHVKDNFIVPGLISLPFNIIIIISIILSVKINIYI